MIEEMAEPEAAVAIVHTRGTDERVLLIRRTEREDDSWSGHWAFPGGRRDREDPDLLQTALRELAEECGICLGREQMSAALRPVVARRRVGPFVLVAPFLFRIERELTTVLDTREAAEAKWVPVKVLRDPTRHRLRCVPGLPGEMLFPAIEIGGMPLWGFSYRLITDWLGLGPKQGPVELAGFHAACRLLDFLLSHGLTVEHGWANRSATVKGSIPTALVLEQFALPGSSIPRVNMLEVQPDYIRIVGLAFEEYFIYGSGNLPGMGSVP
jgi:8-oxo-dGTP pyrophosphatase MutT (NUDIX family)